MAGFELEKNSGDHFGLQVAADGRWRKRIGPDASGFIQCTIRNAQMLDSQKMIDDFFVFQEDRGLSFQLDLSPLQNVSPLPDV